MGTGGVVLVSESLRIEPAKVKERGKEAILTWPF